MEIKQIIKCVNEADFMKEDKMAEGGPAHLKGLATWINHQDKDPPICPTCDTDEDVEWDNVNGYASFFIVA